MKKYILIITIIGATVLMTAAQGNSTQLKTEIDSTISSYYSKGQFNGSVLIAFKDKKVYDKAWGYSDLETDSFLDEQSQYYIASISKLFTSSAILLLNKQGKLSLDDRVTSFLPELPECYQNVRIYHLLSHSGGIPEAEGDWQNRVGWDNSDVMLFLCKREQLDFVPGTDYRYSNNGFVLLAMVVERVSAQPYDSYLKQNIFDKAGMDHSFVVARSLEVDPMHIVRSYVQGKQADWPLYVVGPSGIYTTTHDLFLWDRAFFNYELFDKSEVKNILKPVLVNGAEQNYGLGWGVLKMGGESYAGHMGGMFGFRSLYEHQVNQNRTLIIFTNNGDHTPLMEIRNKLAQVMAKYPYND